MTIPPSPPLQPTSSAPKWVPLFITRPDEDSPLITATLLPPTPRRTGFTSPDTHTYSSSGSSTSDTDEQRSLWQHEDGQPGSLRIDAITTGVNTRNGSPSPELRNGVSSRRDWSEKDSGARTTARSAPQQHTRKRSSASIVMSMPGLGVAIPGSSAMQRLQSLTSFMSLERDSNSSSCLTTSSSECSDDPRRRSHISKYQKQLADEKAKVWKLVIKGTFGAFALLVALASLNFVFTYGLIPATTTDVTVLPPWLDDVLPSSLHSALSLIETVPYPSSTHPRTPVKGDGISLTDYLTTRLGSHFSVPLSSTPAHLWLSPATNHSIRISAPHLVAFINRLDSEAVAENVEREKSKKTWHKQLMALMGVDDAVTETSAKPPSVRRALVLLCLDEGCMEECRTRDWLCFGGFQIANLVGDKKRKAREMVKLIAAVETLTSGRRVFIVDGDVYFRDDPVPHMGDLDNFDIQIPDSWSSSRTKAGFVFLNPTTSVISLWQRLLEIARIDDDRESKSWATTNILLDPTGMNRHGRHTPTADVSDDVSDIDAVASGYGQTEFESPWAGGMDVKVLDRKRFRTSTGRLDGHAFSRALAGLAVYFQCACCEDQITTDYIAGALGYHQPSVAFPAPLAPGGVPHFPMMLTATTLNGTEASLSFALGLMFQASRDTSRSFVPPLNGFINSPIQTHPVRERYIWRMFPAARWAKGGTHDFRSGALRKLNVDVLEPLYVQHALQYLDVTHGHKEAGKESIADLNATLVIDATEYRDYKDFLQTIIRPFFSTTRVVVVENADKVMGRKGWELRPEYDEVEMCWEDPKEAASLGADGSRSAEDTKCSKHCMRKPTDVLEGAREVLAGGREKKKKADKEKAELARTGGKVVKSPRVGDSATMTS